MENLKSKEQEKEFPSVELAYPLAVSAYELMQKRYDTIHSRLQTLLGFITLITLGVITIASKKNLDFSSYWFIAAIFLYFVSIGIYGQQIGKLQMLNPSILFKEWLHWENWEFKKNLIFWSGEGFTANSSLINRKGNISSICSIIFAFEVLSLVFWLV